MGFVISLNEASKIREKAQASGKKVVFTNGCFDVLHRGHVEYLSKACKLGDILIVGLNSDQSVKKLKGPNRSFFNESDRAYILSSLTFVDYVIIFEEESPIELIATLVPDTLVKGGDWPVDKIVGRDIVEKAGGKVVSIKTSVPDYSSSFFINRILSLADRTVDKA